MIKKILSSIAILSLLFFSACLGVIFYVSEQPWVDFSVLEHYNPGKPSILLDDEGNEWGRFQLDKREVVKLSLIPKKLIDAFLAAEDWSFYTHSGLSIKGIVRSLVKNLAKGRKAQGASTITQQLVRLLYFESGKSYTRKIKEQLLSIVIERQFTKEQILETYLNHIYLGSGIYGVEAACQRFWGKHVQNITVDEAAVLAAIVRSPRTYCPLNSIESSTKRRNLILKNMFTLGSITKQEYEAARLQPVAVLKRGYQCLGAHIKETMRIFLEETVGKEKLYTGGLTIQTTLNKEMQEAAEKVFLEQFTKLRKKFADDLEGGLFCMEGETGAIKALVGGYSFSSSQFNRALHARRQIGSTFKPLVYAQALMCGRSFADCEIDEPLTMVINNQEWSPQNQTDTFDGPMTLAHALSTSNNILAIKTYLASDPARIVKLAQACNLPAQEPYPSLALGCIDAPLSHTVCMMNIFAHQGTYVEPYCICWIKDEWGSKLWKAPVTEKRVVLSPTISSQVAKVLTYRVEEAKAVARDKWCECEALGKTGTTNDARTCWFVGATPRYTTGVYIGHDDNRSLGKKVFGNQTAVPIWRDFNKLIKNDIKQFPRDPSLREVTIHKLTGAYCDKSDPGAITILVP